MSVVQGEEGVRPAAVADSFYPADADALGRAVDGYISIARHDVNIGPKIRSLLDERGPPKAIIAPHAGYRYSGAVAGSAYAMLAARRHEIRRVVLAGPAHRVAFSGLALPEARAFRSPLGAVPIASGLVREVEGHFDFVFRSAQAHRFEHSLEVHLPFLQRCLDDFELLPLVVGRATPVEVASVLDFVWGGRETLVVISSDLSHFHEYGEAERLDTATVRAIADHRGPLTPQQACGAAGINGLNALAERRRLRTTLLDLRNSGDTAGTKSRVVGYASLAVWEQADLD